MAPLLANAPRKLKSRDIPAVWFVTDPARVRDVGGAIAALPPGMGVIFRHYHVPERKRLAQALAGQCRARGLVFVVADDWRLAAAVGADGLHLPEYAAARGPSAGARLWRKNRGALLTAAAHGSRALARACALAADAVLLSPVFPTRSHPDRATLGIARARILARAASLPVLALGGVTPKMLPALIAAGFAGIAGVGFAVKED